MKRFVLAALFAVAIMATGTVQALNSTPRTVLDKAAIAQVRSTRLRDDPPPPVCPPICDGDPSNNSIIGPSGPILK